MRDERGRWLGSGNPSGRPKGSVGFAARIREATNEGADLIDVCLKIAHDPDEDGKVRLEACELLLNRMLGKAITPIALDARVDSRVEQHDLRRLSDDELKQLVTLTSKALPVGEETEDAEVLE